MELPVIEFQVKDDRLILIVFFILVEYFSLIDLLIVVFF